MKLARFLLYPFAVLYDLITSIRNLFFDIGIFKQTSFNVPVIIVGNLSVGGTGKTPQIEYLIRLLNHTYKIAVLSRGYKRKTKGFVLLNKNHAVEDVGDEPLQYFKKFKNIKVAVDANRVSGIKKLLAINSLNTVLFDDAFQHRKVKGSFYILLTKYDDLFVDDFLLPTGNLRESSTGAKRAAVILVTKCPDSISLKEQKLIKDKLEKYNKKIFFTAISYASTLSGNKQISIEHLKDYKVLLITGIANPKPLTDFLTDRNINFKHLKFSDHHEFSTKEIDQIKEDFKTIKESKKRIITTEKDYIRLVDKLNDVSFLEIETVFLENQKEQFNTMIKTHLLKNRR